MTKLSDKNKLKKPAHVSCCWVSPLQVEFFYRDGTDALYDTDGSGYAEHDYAKHGRAVVPCDRYVKRVAWTDFGTHGWMGREIEYSLAGADGVVVTTLEQAAGYAPDCADDTWAQVSWDT